MDGVGARLARGVDQLLGVQVGLARVRLPDRDGLVGLADVEGIPVGVRVDGDRGELQLATGADHAESDLAAVGDQDLAHHPSPSATRS
jgi:hypothetical protein